MPSSRGGGGGGGGGSSSNNSSSGRSSRLRIHASPPRALAVGEACQSIIDIYIYIYRERERAQRYGCSFGASRGFGRRTGNSQMVHI